jgi:hypothetical protein
MAIAHAHARSHATNAMTRLEVKKKNHAATVQQTNVRSFQPAPPGLVSAIAIARASGAQGPENKKTSVKQRFHLRTAPAEN